MLPSGPHKQEMMQALHRLFDAIRGLPLDADLAARLNREFGVGTDAYAQLKRLMLIGVEEGWAGYVEIEGDDYRRGQIADVSDETAGMSVESGLLKDVRGQYHCHTHGEINMVIPLEAGSQFSGHGEGWCVFGPMSEHFPTVKGRALMLYFLPGGEIEYRTPPAA
ncbi:MAG TPA: DUF4863 family protein [Trinickia sp.]|jgi:2-hydroxylaminobenzoate mutase|nr:DUF4863 family protein [Trinickia sp.]